MHMDTEVFYIAGDLCPTSESKDLFIDGDARALLGPDLYNRLINSRGLAFNLEVALSDAPSPIVKSGPCLIAPEMAANALAAMNPICACLANNHIADSGTDGLSRTLAALDSRNIPHCGATDKVGSNSKYYIFEMAGKSYALYTCAEHEFTICEKNKPGANPFEATTTYQTIRELAEACDMVIVLYHGMKENYRYPSPNVRDRCRLMADAGASLVCCQHSHCIGCMEKWHNSTIVYGQGNFHFVRNGASIVWNTGILVSITATDEISFLPIRAEGSGIQLLTGNDAAFVLEGFEKRSADILKPGFVESSWERFCADIANGYAMQILNAVEPRWLSFLVRALHKLRLCRPRLATGIQSAGFLNMLQCEAHNEVLQTYLKRHLDD